MELILNSQRVLDESAWDSAQAISLLNLGLEDGIMHNRISGIAPIQNRLSVLHTGETVNDQSRKSIASRIERANLRAVQMGGLRAGREQPNERGEDDLRKSERVAFHAFNNTS